MGFFDKKKGPEDLDKPIEGRRVEDEQRLRLHREELDIAKDRVQTGEVILGKEIVEERKTVDVPVTREEVIIERKTLDNEFSEEPIGEEEVIRIPVTEERVDVGKHTVVTGEVVAHRRAVEETRQVSETLRREEARVDKEGDPDLVEGDHPGD